MRRVAEAIASWIDRHVMTDGASARRITGLVGPGTNGGDALVALGILSRSNWLCEAVTVHRNEPGDLPLTDIERAGVVFTETPNLANCDVILDGVCGYRSRPTLPPDIAVLFRGINAVRAARPVPIVAIDVPSGIDAGVGEAAVDTLRADVTLCLGLPKLGITREPAASMAGQFVSQARFSCLGATPAARDQTSARNRRRNTSDLDMTLATTGQSPKQTKAHLLGKVGAARGSGSIRANRRRSRHIRSVPALPMKKASSAWSAPCSPSQTTSGD